MQSVIPKGSLVITRQIDPSSIQIGDDITYMLNERSSITHRVVGITENYENSGSYGFETKGVDNENPDENIVYAKNVVGKVIFHVPNVGSILLAISENWMLVVLPFCGLLILASLLKFVFSEEKSADEIQ
jgi:signal peptidase